MPATRSFVRNFLLSQAHLWAWRDPTVFQRLLQEDDSALDRAVTIWRLTPEDRDPEDTCNRISDLYKALAHGPKTLGALCEQFGLSGKIEQQRTQRALGVLMLGDLIKYDDLSKNYMSELSGDVEFYINTYRVACLGRHVCG